MKQDLNQAEHCQNLNDDQSNAATIQQTVINMFCQTVAKLNGEGSSPAAGAAGGPGVIGAADLGVSPTGAELAGAVGAAGERTEAQGVSSAAGRGGADVGAAGAAGAAGGPGVIGAAGLDVSPTDVKLAGAVGAAGERTEAQGVSSAAGRANAGANPAGAAGAAGGPGVIGAADLGVSPTGAELAGITGAAGERTEAPAAAGGGGADVGAADAWLLTAAGAAGSPGVIGAADLDGSHTADIGLVEKDNEVQNVRAEGKDSCGSGNVAAPAAEAVAVVFKDTRLTYSQLDAVTLNLAAHLKARGLGAEDVVAILIPRCEYMAIAPLGVARAGCCYQPLDATYPVERLEFMTQDSGAKLLITTPELKELLPDFTGDILFINDIPSLPAFQGTQVDLGFPSPDALFTLLYTSGSTGKPKGCMLTFGNITAFCQWYRDFYSIDNTCRCTIYASFGFDASMMDTFGPLMSGASVYIIPEEIRLDLLALNEYYEANNITHSFMTTQVGRQFALCVENHSLKFLSTGGEALVPLEPPTNYTFCNLYGPTECTVLCTAFKVDKYYDKVPIGKAIPSAQLYVVDKQGNQVAPGENGELWIAGPQVSRGYLNRPEKTAEAFSANPFTDDPAYSHVYHTGDIVRVLPDGNIDFIGRSDMQVKIRGFRIELSEIEEVIRRFPGITDATVVAFDEEGVAGGGKYVAAYVVSPAPVDVDALAAFIAETKPPYMVPAVTMQIDAIPLNQNQKVDKRALPKPVKKLAEIVPPQTDVQRRIFNCVADAIGHTDFGITTDIYYAGLTSISAIRLNVLLAREFDIVIKTSDLKDASTVTDLEQFVAKAARASAREVRQAYPLTANQYGVFVDCMADLKGTGYNNPFLLKLDARVDIERLRAAIVAAVDAHPFLKAQLFMNEQGEVLLRRDDTLPVHVSIESGLDAGALVRPFAIFNEPLYRLEIHNAPDGTYFFVDIHHIVIDGTSLYYLLEDINAAYGGAALEVEAYTSYDLALDEADAVGGAAWEEAHAHYKQVFEGCGGTTRFYPDHAPAPDQMQADNLVRVSGVLRPGDVREICARYGITENIFFMGAFGACLARYNFAKRAVFTSIYHGRNDSRLARTIGMLVKTLPVRCDVEGGAAEYFARLQEQIMTSMDKDAYPFSQVSREFDISPDVLFVYQGDNFNFDEIGGLPATSIELPGDTANIPVVVEVFLKDGAYEFNMRYRAAMYDRATAECILANFETCVAQLCARVAPDAIQLAFDEARTMEDDPAYTGKTYVELFARAAAAHPERPAVIDATGSITFAQLDAMSDVVAQRLVQNGFGPDQIAGVLSARRAEFVAAALGVMKAGGAYTPLDPEYPQERLEYMLENSGSANLLTTRDLEELCGAYAGNVIYLDTLKSDSEGFVPDAACPLPAPAPDNLAYVIYTSGSTGKPKGVLIEHHNLVNLAEYCIKAHNIGPSDISGEFASFCFDASIIGLWPPLAAGAAVYIFPEEIRKDAISVVGAFREVGITISAFPTQMGELVAEMLDDDDCALRTLILGGEKFKRYYPRPYVMVNGYGPTENTVSSTEFVVDKPYANIPIGRSQLNVRSYVVDENMRRVPVGMPGELCHAGRQIARGYHKLPEKTAACFVENPFATCEDEARLYRTGDMVRMKGDGNLEYIGRIDSQIKIRGYRVELSEIEGALLKWDGVVEVACVGLEQNGVTYIAAYYTGPEVDEATWREFLQPLLPEYMMPTYITRLDAMPITPGGKIDKRALPKPQLTSVRANFVAPETPLQAKLCAMFAKALGLDAGEGAGGEGAGAAAAADDTSRDMSSRRQSRASRSDSRTEHKSLPEDAGAAGNEAEAAAAEAFAACSGVGIDDDFFELGGTSLSASKIAVMCLNEDVPLVYADIFKHPTVRALAAIVAEVAPAEEAANEFTDYSYAKINQLLAANSMDNLGKLEVQPLGNVLITGATGFLGIHVLKEFLDNYTGVAYCLVRRGGYESPERRLMNMMMYYFDAPHTELFGSRIVCVEGDITDAGCVEALAGVEFDTLVNCAACVKHFAANNLLEEINVGGVLNMIEVCRRTGRALVQISTVSIAGEGIDGVPAPGRLIAEDDLFFGQRIANEYIRTKFLAERAVLEAAAGGLRARVVRVANLMSRQRDGEFQINFITNGFLRTLRGYVALGAFPVESMNESVEFSPIDEVAAGVLRVAQAGGGFSVFHVANSHRIFMGDVVYAMRECGFDLEIVGQAEFERRLGAYAAAHEDAGVVGGLIAYSQHDEGAIYPIDYSNRFTTEVLYRMGYKWPITDNAYLRQAIEALKNLNFFDAEFFTES